MPDSVVSSPVAVTRTRRLPVAVGRPADHLVARFLLGRSGLAGDHRFDDVRLALLDDAIGGNVSPGSYEHEVVFREFVNANFFDLNVLNDAFGCVRHQLG